MVLPRVALHLTSNNFTSWRVNVKLIGQEDFHHMPKENALKRFCPVSDLFRNFTLRQFTNQGIAREDLFVKLVLSHWWLAVPVSLLLFLVRLSMHLKIRVCLSPTKLLLRNPATKFIWEENGFDLLSSPNQADPCVLISLHRMQSSTKKAHLWAHTLQAGMHSVLAIVFIVLKTCGDVGRQGLRLACRQLFRTGRFGATRQLFWRRKCWINTLHLSLRHLCAKVSPSLSFTSSNHIQVTHFLVLKDSIFC